MLLTYLTIAVLSAVVLAAAVAASPATDGSRSRGVSRRRRFVEQNPAHVNSQDIRLSLVREGVDREQAAFITDKAAEHGIKPFTMWLWLEQFDAEALSIVVAADLSHHELIAHISEGTVPDLEELRLFASANGLTLGRPAARKPRRKVLVESSGRTPHPARRHSMPPIEGPGLRSPRLGEDGLAA